MTTLKTGPFMWLRQGFILNTIMWENSHKSFWNLFVRLHSRHLLVESFCWKTKTSRLWTGCRTNTGAGGWRMMSSTFALKMLEWRFIDLKTSPPEYLTPSITSMIGRTDDATPRSVSIKKTRRENVIQRRAWIQSSTASATAKSWRLMESKSLFSTSSLNVIRISRLGAIATIQRRKSQKRGRDFDEIKTNFFFFLWSQNSFLLNQLQLLKCLHSSTHAINILSLRNLESKFEESLSILPRTINGPNGLKYSH